jgi:CHAD domain-containing protein
MRMGFQWSADDASIGDGFVRIAREQIEKAIAVASDTDESPAKRVHEARRRAKKLRALFRLVRPDFRHYAEENAFVRDAARRLSSARDLKVAADTLTDLMQWAERDVAPIVVSAEAGDEEAGLARYTADMREMLARTERWKAGRIDLDTLADGLADTYRRGLEALQHVAAHPSDEGFHEWRKHAKYHWNQLGLLEACAEDILPSAHQAVGDLAEVLGLHHDLAMLRDKLTDDAGLLGELDIGMVLDAVARRQRELEVQIGTLGRQVYAETPKGLHARFSSYLEGWAAQEATA